MELRTLLQKAAEEKKPDPEEVEKKEEKYFDEFYQKWKGTKAEDNDFTYKIIPKFYFKVFINLSSFKNIFLHPVFN